MTVKTKWYGPNWSGLGNKLLSHMILFVCFETITAIYTCSAVYCEIWRQFVERHLKKDHVVVLIYLCTEYKTIRTEHISCNRYHLAGLVIWYSRPVTVISCHLQYLVMYTFNQVAWPWQDRLLPLDVVTGFLHISRVWLNTHMLLCLVWCY